MSDWFISKGKCVDKTTIIGLRHRFVFGAKYTGGTLAFPLHTSIIKALEDKRKRDLWWNCPGDFWYCAFGLDVCPDEYFTIIIDR